MTAAEDRREELEAFLWQHVAPAFPDRRQGAAVVKAVMDCSDAYAKAARPRARKPAGPPQPKKPPALHYAPEGVDTHTACRPSAYDLTAARWLKTSIPADVTCGHCAKVLAVPEGVGP